MFTKKSTVEKKQDLNRKLEVWQINRIKYKCSITLLGLLEGQKS